MTGFVPCHLVNGVVDRIEVESLGTLCKVGLACGCAILGFNTHFEVLLGAVGYDFAEELSKLGCMLCFFKSCLLPIKSDLGIAFPVCDPCHRKIHTDFTALAVEVVLEALRHFGVVDDAVADVVLRDEIEFAARLRELRARNAALGALLGSRIAFMNIPANRANPLDHFLLSFLYRVEKLFANSTKSACRKQG